MYECGYLDIGGENMLLVIDVGNTHIIFGVYRQDKLLSHWRIATEKNKTSDEYGLLFRQMFTYKDIEYRQVKSIIISSVVPPLTHILSKMSKDYFQINPMVVGPGIKTGINIKFEDPKEVGADRIVNAIAGYEKYSGPLIIVDFGTAITFCAVSRKGEYLGGTIAPGISISSDALFKGAAKLPKVDLYKPKNIIGKNTVESIQSGLSYGYIGMIDYIVSNMKKEMEVKNQRVEKVIATGELADFMARESIEIDLVDKFLTFEGLKIVYKRNIN